MITELVAKLESPMMAFYEYSADDGALIREIVAALKAMETGYDRYNEAMVAMERIGWPCPLIDLPDEYKALGDALAEARAELDRKNAALQFAANIFDNYVTWNQSQGTPEGATLAERNTAFRAAMMTALQPKD